MKLKKYKDAKTGTEFWYQINNVEDLIDLEDNPYFKYNSFAEFFDMTKERQAKQKAKDIISDFFSMIADDMIENNDFFVFPQYRFGRMYVGDISSFTWKRQGDIIETGGKRMGLKLIINQMTNRYSSKMFRGRFNRVNSQRVLNNVLKGHKY